MPVIDPDAFELVERPELVIGVVAPVGTPLNYVCNTIEQMLKDRQYDVETIKLSELLDSMTLPTPVPSQSASTFERIMALMNRGNELRTVTEGGEALALLAAARINEKREYRRLDGSPPHMSGRAFILRQLKHPDEVLWLRKIYGDSFHLVGVFCPEEARINSLTIEHGMHSDQATLLIRRDESEEHSYGQQLRDTYYRSDVFVEMLEHGQRAASQMEGQLERYFKLLFGELDEGVITPTADEYGMHLASTAALRSSDLSRQVGAAILSPNREVLAVGCNDVPSAGGGQYWPDGKSCRDCDLGEDSNAIMKKRILREMLETVDSGFGSLPWKDQDQRLMELAQILQPTRIMNLTEFGRAVHAEMDSLLAAGRIGVSTRQATLYTTTFPCHNCAKHIVASGIQRVVYIEPYPKSLALELHNDAISMSIGDEHAGKVQFRSFVGVAPRRYETLFSMVGTDGRRYRRKDKDGKVLRENIGLRMRSDAITYIEKEVAAALAAKSIGDLTMKEADQGDNSPNSA